MKMDAKDIPECPFCGRFINRPGNVRLEFTEIIASRCLCGAVYACDPTGKNLGEVYVDALAFFRGTWEFDFNTNDKDFYTREFDYDLKKHRYINVKGENRHSGKLIFINNYDVKKQKEVKVKRLQGNLKDILHEYLNSQQFQRIAELTEDNHSVVSKLISLSYDKDDLVSWRAIHSFYEISRRLTPLDPLFMRNTIRRLLWSMSDESGGIGWSACEILGMIISADVNEYSDVLPLLWSFREEEMFKAGVMWAIYHIALSNREALFHLCDELRPYHLDINPYVRVYSISASKIIGCLNDAFTIPNDDALVTYFENGQLNTSTVSEAIKNLIKGYD